MPVAGMGFYEDVVFGKARRHISRDLASEFKQWNYVKGNLVRLCPKNAVQKEAPTRGCDPRYTEQSGLGKKYGPPLLITT